MSGYVNRYMPENMFEVKYNRVDTASRILELENNNKLLLTQIEKLTIQKQHTQDNFDAMCLGATNSFEYTKEITAIYVAKIRELTEQVERLQYNLDASGGFSDIVQMCIKYNIQKEHLQNIFETIQMDATHDFTYTGKICATILQIKELIYQLENLESKCNKLFANNYY